MTKQKMRRQKDTVTVRIPNELHYRLKVRQLEKSREAGRNILLSELVEDYLCRTIKSTPR